MTDRPVPFRSQNGLPALQGAHPLARALIGVLTRGASVLEIGRGSGRNTRALREASLNVTCIADADAHRFDVVPASFDAALSTHAFLHGTPALVRRMLGATALGLKAAAPFYCTFGSTRDARFGQGRFIEKNTYAQLDGPEAGVAHVYFEHETLRRLLERNFLLEALQEQGVDDVVGTWAHGPPSGSVHWFARLRKPG